MEWWYTVTWRGYNVLVDEAARDAHVLADSFLRDRIECAVTALSNGLAVTLANYVIQLNLPFTSSLERFRAGLEKHFEHVCDSGTACFERLANASVGEPVPATESVSQVARKAFRQVGTDLRHVLSRRQPITGTAVIASGEFFFSGGAVTLHPPAVYAEPVSDPPEEGQRAAGSGQQITAVENSIAANLGTNAEAKVLNSDPERMTDAEYPLVSEVSVTEWTAVEIVFLSDERLQISGRLETVNYAEFGLEDRRSHTPNRAWLTLRLLAESEGDLPLEKMERRNRSKVEKRIQEIRGALKRYFKLSSDPVRFTKRSGYRTVFKIRRSPAYET